jgi:hypothetical protein
MKLARPAPGHSNNALEIASSPFGYIFHGRFLAGFLSGIIMMTLYYNMFGMAAILTQLTEGIQDISEFVSPTAKANRMEKYLTVYNYTPPLAEEPGGHPASICGTGQDFEDFFKLSHQVRSRLKEDLTIYNLFFKNKLNNTGTYVELGAFDGSIEANTKFFDICLGWKGLLIEGNPISFQKVIKNRPQAHRISFAPSCDAKFEQVNKTIEFYKYPMTNARLLGKALTYEGKPTVDVPCGPLSPVLEDIFEGAPINFFSLDVEGAEPMVLRTIDFNKVMIEVMMIEVKNNHCGAICKSRDEIRSIMKQAGYKRYERVVQASDVYVHPNSRFQMPYSVKPDE